eukprot:262878_1
MTNFTDTQSHTITESNNDMKVMSEETKEISKEGFLEKKSLLIGKFRKRFICLNNNHLYSYKTETGKDLTENIDLKWYKKAVLTENDLSKFELIPQSNTDKIRVFAADSFNNAKEWVNDINSFYKGVADPICHVKHWSE